jgi:hypothetical protein
MLATAPYECVFDFGEVVEVVHREGQYSVGLGFGLRSLAFELFDHGAQMKPKAKAQRPKTQAQYTDYSLLTRS